MTRTFKEEMPLIARYLSPRYQPFYCNQLASHFIPRYVDAIYRQQQRTTTLLIFPTVTFPDSASFLPCCVVCCAGSKRIGEMGAQQMSLDAHSLKATLLALPTLGNDLDDDPAHRQRKKTVATKSYTKYVTTEMSKAEALLKTLVSPNERLIVTFKALLPKSSTDDLYRVFTLKGLKKQEIQQLLDAYNAQVSPEDQVKLGGSTGSGALSGTSTPSGSAKTNLKSFLSNLGGQ